MTTGSVSLNSSFTAQLYVAGAGTSLPPSDMHRPGQVRLRSHRSPAQAVHTLHPLAGHQPLHGQSARRQAGPLRTSRYSTTSRSSALARMRIHRRLRLPPPIAAMRSTRVPAAADNPELRRGLRHTLQHRLHQRFRRGLRVGDRRITPWHKDRCAVCARAQVRQGRWVAGARYCASTRASSASMSAPPRQVGGPGETAGPLSIAAI